MADLFGRSSYGGKAVTPVQTVQALAIGSTTIIAYTPPAGKLSQICDLSFVYAGTITGVTVNYGIQIAGVNYWFSEAASIVQNVISSPAIPSPCYLEQGQSLVVQINGVTVGGSNVTINVFANEFTPDSAYHS